MTDRHDHSGLFPAWVAAQAELANPKKSAKVQVQTKTGGSYGYTYAPLDAIIAEVRPVLARHGLAFWQDVVPGPDDSVGVKTTLVHESGQAHESGPVFWPAGHDVKDLGGTITYLRRYALTAVLGIAAEEDTDATNVPAKERKPRPPAAAPAPPYEDVPANDPVPEAKPDDGSGITDPQRKAIFAISKKIKLSEEGLHRVIAGRFEGVESVNDLTKAQASSLIDDMQAMQDGEG
jgi:hypothetical protein